MTAQPTHPAVRRAAGALDSGRERLGDLNRAFAYAARTPDPGPHPGLRHRILRLSFAGDLRGPRGDA